MAVPYEPSLFLRNLSLFSDERHNAFYLQPAGVPKGAALLVHGFPGTPADMRSLADSFIADGWAVDAPLLPGFGSQIASLPSRRHREWQNAVGARVRFLREDHAKIVVIGHSLGGAVSILSADQGSADGYVLLTPYWRFGGALSHAFWPILRLFFGRWTPLKNADFSDERVRTGLLRVIPDLDIDDWAVQEELRQFVVPTALLNELRRLGTSTARAARRLMAPTLVFQGLRDTMVRPEHTASLVARLPRLSSYEIVDGSHNLPSPDDGAWERIERTTLAFANGL